MLTFAEKNLCSGCGACASACPGQCISMERDGEGFLYPVVDEARCVGCGLCERACPAVNPPEKTDYGRKAYAAFCKEESIRLKSSSGGVFTLLAEYVIAQGGVVFGAALTEDLSVEHIRVERIEDLSRLRGSKYMQSRIGEAYREAGRLLEDGRLVLFTGTPCQIDGLYSYLKKRYDNLLTQDVVCHGAPSPMVWEKYKCYMEARIGSGLTGMCFRSKKTGWKNYSVSMEFENGSEVSERFYENLYMRAFLADLSLRPSCYNCRSKSLERQSDITLADFWGVQDCLPEMDDDKGTSLAVIHSEAGRRVFDAISEKLRAEEVEIQDAVRGNPSFVKAARRPDRRDAFFASLEQMPFDAALKRAVRIPLGRRAISRLKRFVKRFMTERA